METRSLSDRDREASLYHMARRSRPPSCMLTVSNYHRSCWMGCRRCRPNKSLRKFPRNMRGRAKTALALLLGTLLALTVAQTCDGDVCFEEEEFTFPSSGYFGPGDVLQPITMPEQKIFRGVEFPLVLGPNPTNCPNGCSLPQVAEWVNHSSNVIDNLLLKHGAILFRGFPIDTPESFNAFVESFGFDNFPYVGGAAVRRQLAPRVFTTNESPPTEKIPFHHEMAQVPKFPTKLWFQCQVPPATGGETPVLPSWEICAKLEAKYPELIAKLQQGVRYIRVLPEEDDPSSAIGRGWKSTYATTSRPEVEERLASLNYTGEWLPDGSLKTISPILPAVRIDDGPGRTHKKTFFNSVVAVYTGWNDARNRGETAIQFADGGYLDAAIMADAVKIMDETAVAFPWQRGDVILIDNKLVMHARKPFTGPRLITASLGTHATR